MNTIALVDFHDSLVSNIVTNMSNCVRIQLSHLPVYIVESPGHYGVWSYESELLCENVSRADIQLALPLDEADSVSSCDILASDGTSVRFSDTTTSAENATLKLTWSLSANVVSLAAQRLVFCLGKKLERLDTWTGSLAELLGTT